MTQEQLQEFYKLNPELNPNKPDPLSKLDPEFLQQLIQDKGNPLPNPPMSVGSPASTGEYEHPMSIQPPPSPEPTPQPIAKLVPQMARTPQNIPFKAPMSSQKPSTMGDELSNIMFGRNNLSTVDNLKQAQQSRDSDMDIAEIMRLSALLGSSQSGVKNEYLEGAADRLDKRSGNKVADLEQQVGAQKSDPTSAVSQGYRDMMKQFGVNIQGDASAADMEKIAPWIAKAYEGEQGRENQRVLVGEKAKDRAAYLQGKKADKNSLEQDHFIERASKQLGAVAKDYAKVRQAAQLADGMDNKNAVAQVTALYNLISSLDPQSTVREGEIHLATSAGGLSGKIETVFSQLSRDPQLIDEKTIQSIKSEIKRIATIQKGNYDARSQVFRNQAKSRGVEDRFNEIDPYSEENILSGKSSGGGQDFDKEEKGIQRVMDNNKVSREEAIKALQKAGKL